ncbi:hypothetical protein like AT4G36750 [Hibiscus trionum]|uniref:Flavodoxin-like domain-containing protein n=1 Tax=Hibiscus trionum TaxID=183268 RepID=A0A9W7MLE3_HIBTR|nr:hypothetical protein like AT4G36750 [Hibiscus trionum]
MGKDGGCVPRKKKHSSSAEDASRRCRSSATTTNNAPIIASDEDICEIPVAMVNSTNTQSTLKLFIVFYSMYGHVEELAKRMKKGVEGVEGVEVVLFRVPETLPADVLVLIKVPPKDLEIPEISTTKLVEANGFLFRFPTRCECMVAQMKAFFDSTDQLLKEKTLAEKPAEFFVSIGTQGGGQETTT